jgi:hypothetical protein
MRRLLIALCACAAFIPSVASAANSFGGWAAIQAAAPAESNCQGANWTAEACGGYPVNPQPPKASPATPVPQCKTDWQQCADNATLIDDQVKIPNVYGTPTRTEVKCKYDLRSEKDVSVSFPE